MNILSVFDGISCGQVALNRSGIKVDKYFSSEIKPHAINVTQKHFPSTIQLGDISNIHYTNMGIEVDLTSSICKVYGGGIDLLIGGSPCKGGSGLNKNRDGLEHKESKLFFEYVRLLKELRMCGQDVYFLLENVGNGNKSFSSSITRQLGVKPIIFNSSWVSAQNRVRYYWTNIPVNTLPKKKYITTKDVFDDNMPEELILTNGRVAWLESDSGKKSIRKGYTKINPFPKASCITANGHIKWNCNYIYKDGVYRSLSIRELESLQTLPEGYCDGIEYGEAYDLIGDGWTIDIISHIFNHIPRL